jgi:hypothetical protein
MRTLIFLLCLFFPAGLSAQDKTPDSRLSSYEQNRYGGSLWAVPREPYQSRYKADSFKAKVYDQPESTVRERFQSRMQWEGGQREISERAARGYRNPNK